MSADKLVRVAERVLAELWFPFEPRAARAGDRSSGPHPQVDTLYLVWVRLRQEPLICYLRRSEPDKHPGWVPAGDLYWETRANTIVRDVEYWQPLSRPSKEPF